MTRSWSEKENYQKFESNKVQYGFKPIIAIFYAGLRRNEVAYHPDLQYSGLKGENLIYEDGTLAFIYLPPTKGRKERQIPLNHNYKKFFRHTITIRGNVEPLYKYIKSTRSEGFFARGRYYLLR